MVHVLAVEDSPTQAARLCADLEESGFEVTLARSGTEALLLLEESRFDVIASDVVMPGMTGYELCRQVKDDPRLRDLPVILLTSLTDPLDVVKGLESGADNFLRKPYDADQLTARLRAAVTNRELRHSGRVQVGVQLSFLDREFDITADRQQILDLLVSTFEELVVTSRAVRDREAELERAHADLEQQLHAIELERQRLRAVVDAVPVPLFVIAPDGLVSHVSDATARVFGSRVEDIRGRRLDEVVSFVDADGNAVPPERLPHQQTAATSEPHSRGGAFDLFLTGSDDRRVPVLLQASPVLDESGRPAGCVGTAHALGTLTEHDALTGLPNAAAFLDRASTILAARHRNSGVLLLELDRAEMVQTARGTGTGNELLVEVARRLRRIFEPTHGSATATQCFLAYLGGYRFGVVLSNLPHSFQMLHLAESARRTVAEHGSHDEDMSLSASVGVALDQGDLADAPLFAAANSALRSAQRRGGNRVEVLDPSASQEALDRLELEVDLRAAVENREIELHYQPEYDLASGRLVGFEALARWQHPRLGQVPPPVFIALAEQSGLIVPLGRQLLEKACAEAQTWTVGDGWALPTIAVNVSAVQLRQGYAEEVREVLALTGLDPARLMLELTETAAMSDPATTVPIIDDLRRDGVRFALDDFGTGYSSMAQLTRTRFDQLKLDRAFTATIHHPGTDAVVARSIIALGQSLEIPVLAEGVETSDQSEELQALGCTLCQGYLFSRPLPPDQVRSLLADGGRLRSTEAGSAAR